MQFSYYTPLENLDVARGYGYAGQQIVDSLNRLGHDVAFDYSPAPVQFIFSMPPSIKLGNNHNILYTPWESTKIPQEWYSYLPLVDEFWTTSEHSRRLFEGAGVRVDNVYPHGIDPLWIPKRRVPTSTLKFLHHGEPASRKGGPLVYEAFRKAFPRNRDVSLTYKATSHIEGRIYGPDGAIQGSVLNDHRVNAILTPMSHKDLVGLYHQHHVMVYPSWGEGFGFIPFQSAATGMPTICTQWWCDYPKYILPLRYTVTNSPWPKMHPGQMAKPSLDDMVDWMREVHDNYDHYSRKAYKLAPQLHDEYNWDRLTEKAFEKVVERFS